MRILYIWDSDYPWDVRVEKICRSLLTAGNQVHIGARNLRKSEEDEIIDGINVHRLKAYNNSRLNYAFSFPAFFSPIWMRFIDEIISKNEIELIIVRDLPMAIAGIWAGRRHKTPVIFDMAENYVALMRDIWKTRKFQGLNLVLRNPYLLEVVARYCFKNTDHTLVVVDEAKAVVVQGGGHPDKITVVGNTPSLEIFRKVTSETASELELIRTRFSAIYVGGIQMGRGIQVVLDAIPQVIKEIPNFLFVVVGDGYASEQLKEMILSSQLQDYVFWAGWVEHERVYDYIGASKIGLIPHFATGHKNTTIPNKLFDYMGMGLPVIATDAVPLKRILTRERCGIVYRSGSSEELADSILKIHQNASEYGNNGRIAVQARYNWAVDEERLIDVVDSIRPKKSAQ